MRRYAFFLLTIVLTTIAWAQTDIVAHIVDAETGEALPYVSVYVSPSKGTLSNSNGDFTISADANDTIRFSCVGYLTQRIPAARIPQTIKLEPSVAQLNELTVLSMSAIMDNVQKQLKRSLKAGGEKHGLYFCRIIEELGEGTDMIEAFVDAKSMVHIRDMKVLSGRQTRMDKLNQRPSLTSMNMHHLLEVGPMMNYNAFWKELIVLPFNDKNYKNKYKWTYTTRVDEKGHYIYVVKMEPNVRTGAGKLMEGTAYIDSRHNRLLRFSGTVPPVMLLYKEHSTGQTTHVATHITIDYSYDRTGMAEIANVSFETRGTNIHAQGLMVRVNDKTQKGKKGQSIDENFLSSIRDAGFDSLLWAKSYIVQRTRQEIIAAGGIPDEKQVNVKNPGLKSIYEKMNREKWTRGQEKVYVHMDNTCYQMGDTLWFAAYTQDANSGQPSEISGVLYAELLNQDGSLVERKIVEMKEGRGNSFFSLSGDRVRSGFCELRAYTRWQLNWPDKLYSRVFPVYPNLPTQNQKPSITTATDSCRALRVSFYPEGGNLLSGIPNRIAFEANWQDGEEADGCLILGNDTITTEHRGRGSFLFTPKQDSTYIATFHAKDGLASVKATLPAAESRGVALQISQTQAAYNILARLSKDMEPKKMALSIRHDGILEEYVPLERKVSADGVMRYQYTPTTEQSGVYQATIFNEEGHIYADRLFYVFGKDKVRTLAISGMQQTYEPLQKVEADIKMDSSDSNGKCNISIAFRDAVNSISTYDDGNIFTEMLLASEIRGFVPNPGWYFESRDEEHTRALDLLMMTQGWRRFGWKATVYDDSLQTIQPREQQIMLTGRAVRTGGKPFKPNRFESKNMQGYHADMDKEAYIHSVLEDDAAFHKLPHKQTYDGGRFDLTIPRFYGCCILHLGASYIDPHQLVSFKWNEKSDWEVFIDRPYPQFATDYTFYQNHLPMDVPLASNKAAFTRRYHDSNNEISVSDNHTILLGFSVPAEFYHPDYSKHKLPEGQKDYRRTLYWNPNLQLDENGEAHITFYNNSTATSISVEAEGQTSDGTLLWSK